MTPPWGRPRLSLRITLTFALGALVVAAAVATSAYVFTYHFLVRAQERSALRQSYVNAAIVRDRMRGAVVDVPSILDALTTGSTSNAVIYHAGSWSSSSLSPSRDALPEPVRTAVVFRHQVVRSWIRLDGRPELVVGVPLPAVDAGYFQFFNEASLGQTLSVLRAVLLSAAAATTAGGAGLGWWASRRLTAPLRTVAEAARRIAAGDLRTRLPAEADADLAGLVESFNTMVGTLRQRIERDARFAADVSHELRSPLTTLSTSLAVLRGRRDELSDRGRDALDLLSVELSRFERLVDDLLEISRADAPDAAAEGQPVRICQLVLNLLERPDYNAVPADIDSAAMDAVVVGDKRRLEQSLRNLLDNANTYAGGATCVSVRAQDGRIVVAVDDSGPGVPAAERELIFDRFARGRNARRRASHAGTGLGLALVREHVRAHHGRVWVTDNPAGGARFVLELPAEVP